VMRKIKMKIELTYNDETMHGDDDEAWFDFVNNVLCGKGDLILHSNYIGDELGTVRVLSFIASDELYPHLKKWHRSLGKPR